MGKEALEEFLRIRIILKETIVFLKIHEEQLIDDAITYLISQKKPYINDLEKNFENIKEVMLKGYLQWIKDHCNEFSIQFDNTYKEESFNNSFLPIYNDVLEYIITILPSINIQKEVKENLEDHLEFLLNP